MSIAIPDSAAGIDARLIDDVAAFAARGVDEARVAACSEGFWRGLRGCGSELWLDTGDMDAADDLWTDEFSALTTNNTLLNREIQKGIYDDLVGEARALLADLDEATRVIEMGFVLNARHGLRLARRFGAKVSVELSTELAHDVERSVFYGSRFHAIAPDDFIVKVPLTPAGLVAARRLRADGVPINFTLGFSARQNHLIARYARPNFVNVFLGRANAYVRDNGLGGGEGVGEKAMLASQRALRAFTGGDGSVRHIAASLRSGEQVSALAGCDVFTMPTKVAAAAFEAGTDRWEDRTADDPEVEGAGGERLEKLWEIAEESDALVRTIAEVEDPAAIVAAARDHGLADLLPEFDDGERAAIAEHGKIPDHARWRERILAGTAAPDSLLNLAGLASFAADQKELDDRIRRLLR